MRLLEEGLKRFEEEVFQYRKQYEVTCDLKNMQTAMNLLREFQYRKRYEVTCDIFMTMQEWFHHVVSIPQAV